MKGQLGEKKRHPERKKERNDRKDQLNIRKTRFVEKTTRASGSIERRSGKRKGRISKIQTSISINNSIVTQIYIAEEEEESAQELMAGANTVLQRLKFNRGPLEVI